MKLLLRITTLIGFFLMGSNAFAQYGIGTNNPNGSAALEIVSPDKGVLIPRIALTASNTLSPITGNASTTHNGMIVYNTSADTSTGLTGIGFYVWQGGATGSWTRLSTTEDANLGTVTHTTLRWDGSAWVENTAFTTDGTGTATVTGDLGITLDASVGQDLTVTRDADIGRDLTVSNNATITGNTVQQGWLNAQSTVTLDAALVDAIGRAGTAGQVLSTTGTSTNWVDNFAPDAGTVTHTTLRWDGTAWVENFELVSDGSNTTSLTTDLQIAGNTTNTGTLEVTGNTTLTSDLYVGANTTASGTLTANSTTTLKSDLVDAEGSRGVVGQILTATVTGTRWEDNFAPDAGTVTHTTLRWDGTAWVENFELVSDGANTTSLTTDLQIAGNTTNTGTLEVTGNSTLSSDLYVGANTTASGTLTANSTTTLKSDLVDAEGSRGVVGQILTATVTGTRWEDNFAPDAGTVTHTTLRWDGTAWVENFELVSDGSNTTSLTTDLQIAGNTTNTGTLEVTGNSTLSSDLYVGANTTASGTLTANSTTTLKSDLVDAEGSRGVVGQILTATVTGTRWEDNFAPDAGTVTHTTLRWDGTAWVENFELVSDGSNTTSLTTDLQIAGNTTNTGTLEVTGNSTLSSDLYVGANTTASGTLTANSTATLNAALVDGNGTSGTTGQILSTTGTQTVWVDRNATTIETFTANATPTLATGLILLEPTAAMSLNLPTTADYPTGFELKIRRNNDYTSGVTITINPNGGETIDGNASRSLNVGYQSLTLLNTGSGWITVN